MPLRDLCLLTHAFQLCNMLATFQKSMLSIFVDMVESTVEVFMDDFSIIGDSFESYLEKKGKVLVRFVETNLVLIW